MLLEACVELAGDGCSVETGKGRFNYHHSATVSVGGDRVATILHGGPNGHPNVEASGDRAPALAAMLRAGGEHRVTRCDVAIDGYGDGLFAELERLALRVASKHGLGVRKIATPLSQSAGETIYIGSRKSAVFARIYEKGKAEAGDYSNADAAQLAPWVRCELEVKPQKEMKALAALMPPEAFWGISAWSMQLATEAFAMSPDPIPFHPRRTSSDEASFAWMCDQYRNLLRRRADTVHGGDRHALALEIVRRVFDEQAEQAA